MSSAASHSAASPPPSALTCSPGSRGPADFYSAALSFAPHVTDKVHHAGVGHYYELIYGIFMMPLLAATTGGDGLRILEIGLGCNYFGKKHRTHAKSARLWRSLAPRATIWAAEYDARCVRENAALWRELRLNTLVGDQGNNATLSRWIGTSGGAFDVVIDDGSHRNSHVLTSFRALWPQLRPGGLYFFEDLLVGRHNRYDDTAGRAVVSDVLQAWMEQLLIPPNYGQRAGCSGPRDRNCVNAKAPAHVRAAEMRARFPLPDNAAFVFCQRSACVVAKKALLGLEGIGAPSKAGEREPKRRMWASQERF